MTSTDPIVISDDDDKDVIVISDDGEVAAPTKRTPSAGVQLMRAFVRARCGAAYDKDASEIERIMGGSGFDSMAEEEDGHESASNKMLILLWINTVTDDYWSYVAADAKGSNHTEQEVARILGNKNDAIDAFICEECIDMRMMGVPVPALVEYKKGFLFRFRERFPPAWWRYVMTSDSEIIFGNNLPSYWWRLSQIPRKYY